MNYSVIKKCDIANGLGVRTSLFVSGCRHHCKGCFQPETWDFDYGTQFTKDVEDEIIDSLKPTYVEGLTLLGGEPFEPENQRVLCDFLQRVKEVYPDKNIWCYTGYLLDGQLLKGDFPRCEVTDKMLSFIDVLVDGEFELDKKSIMLKFKGSSNQRIIDVKKTLEKNKIILFEV